MMSCTELRVLAFITTGGTIAMRRNPDSGVVPAITGDELVKTLPALKDLAQVRVNNLFNIPSDYMTPAHWLTLHAAILEAIGNPEVSAVVVSHGTDTLEETAFFLDLTLKTSKPIILVGAQRNASEADSDGARNLLNALTLAVASEAQNKGVLVVMNEMIHAARHVEKSHTTRVDGFSSGEAGSLGSVTLGKVVFFGTPIAQQTIPLQQNTMPTVVIVAMYAGADGSLIDAAALSGAQGIVIQGLGCGNVNQEMFTAIQRVIAQGVTVVIATRVPNGVVVPIYGFMGGGATLEHAGAILAQNLSPQKARVLLMLALQSTSDSTEIARHFDNSGLGN